MYNFTKILHLCLGCFLLILVGCKNEPKEKAAITRPVKVSTVSTLVSSSKSFSGIITAEQFSNLTFKVSGTIMDMKVDEGQNLKKDQVIAVLDPRDINLQLEASRAAYQTAKSKFERNERLLEKQAISQQEYEMARVEYTNAKAKFENAQNILNDSKLTAPFNGFIEKRYVENYQKVQAGEPIVKLVNLDVFNIRFTIPESSVTLLHSMTSMHVEFETIKGMRFNAKVKEYIDASPDGSGIPVTVIIDDDSFAAYKSMVSTGFSCTVTITTPGPAGNQRVIAIPVSAVFSDATTGSQSVWMYNSNEKSVSRKKVELGQLLSSDLVEIKSGLNGGEVIVTAGVNNIYEGQKVNILEQ